MKKNKCPFHRGQRVRFKKAKNRKYGIVMSDNWATIGDPDTCRIPGGPLVMEGYIYVQWTINGKKYFCMDLAKDFEAF